MPDSLTRTEPLPAAPFVAAGVTITLAPPMARYSLRAREAKTLERLLGVELPAKIGTSCGAIACLGPDEWLLRAPLGTEIASGAGVPVAITDVSERSLCLTIEGPAAARLIMTGCPLDLDDFAVGRATRTIFESVEILIIRESETRFQIEVWRSFAVWLWTALTVSAQHGP